MSEPVCVYCGHDEKCHNLGGCHVRDCICSESDFGIRTLAARDT